ncbi:BTB/POZ domain-containing protein POB1 [Hordeum vulgare]|nr:BTB/POZ domain-containing protein POB1 [Hordeum vulgare]
MVGKERMTTLSVWVEAEMDLELLGGVRVPSFEFSFNWEVFANMVLKIEVVTGGDIHGGSLIIHGDDRCGVVALDLIWDD